MSYNEFERKDNNNLSQEGDNSKNITDDKSIDWATEIYAKLKQRQEEKKAEEKKAEEKAIVIEESIKNIHSNQLTSNQEIEQNLLDNTNKS